MQVKVADSFTSLIESLFKDKKKLIKILSIAVILLLALILKMHNSRQSEITVETVSESSEMSMLCVDIGGAVHSPGIYNVESGTRLYEVIDLAGGLKENADTDSINRAAFIEDGEKIIIPETIVISEETEGDESVAAEDGGSAASKSATDSKFVNINSATKDQLKTLPGIGDVIADRIIEYRQSKRFSKKEDIMQVKGIGSSIYERIKDLIITV